MMTLLHPAAPIGSTGMSKEKEGVPEESLDMVRDKVG